MYYHSYNISFTFTHFHERKCFSVDLCGLTAQESCFYRTEHFSDLWSDFCLLLKWDFSMWRNFLMCSHAYKQDGIDSKSSQLSPRSYQTDQCVWMKGLKWCRSARGHRELRIKGGARGWPNTLFSHCPHVKLSAKHQWSSLNLI